MCNLKMSRTIWNLEKANKLYKEKGLILLEKEYRNNSYPMKALSPDGYFIKINLSNVSIGQSYLNFGPSNPYTIHNIKSFIKRKGLKTKLLSNNYINNNEKLLFKCKCGKIFERTWANFYKGQYDCFECGHSKSIDNQRIGIEMARKVFNKHELKLLENKYMNNSINMLAKDKEGYLVNACYANIVAGRKPRAFSLEFNADNFVHNINLFIKKNKLDCKYLDVVGNDGYGHYILSLRCKCGEIFTVTQSDFLRLAKNRCNRCTAKTSNYEKKTEDFLKEHNIDFVSQKRFKDCRSPKTNYMLPFDFYLPKLNTCIEADGQQHFDKNCIYYKEEVPIYDKYKNNYCKTKGIKLFRIPYWEYDNGNYKTILSNIIQ